MKKKTQQKKASPTLPRVKVRFASDQLGRVHCVVWIGEKKVLLSPADIVPTTPTKLIETLAHHGIVIFEPEIGNKIRIAAKATLKARGDKPTIFVPMVPGWHKPPQGGRPIYLHGAHKIGKASKVFVAPALLDLGDRPGKFSTVGPLSDWRRAVNLFATREPIITFLLSTAFASMILAQLKIQPFVILLHGKTSVGKSSAATFVGSVFGGDPNRPQHGFAESLKITDAGVEKVAWAHNCALLILDEFSRVQGTAIDKIKVLEALVNDFCAGVPKVRATNQLSALTWSSAALITSNDSYADLLTRANQPPADALGPRLIELPADAGTGHGIFASIPSGYFNTAAAADGLREVAHGAYGIAAPEFARGIQAISLTVLRKKIDRWKRHAIERLGSDLTGVDGQRRNKFAAIYAAGMLAKHLGILPKALQIRAAMEWAWAASKESQPVVADPIATVAAYIERHRKEFPRTPLKKEISSGKAAKMSGFRHKAQSGGVKYLIPKAAFDKAVKPCGGPVVAAKALCAAGLLECENAKGGKYQIKRTLGPSVRIRLYAIPFAIRKQGKP